MLSQGLCKKVFLNLTTHYYFYNSKENKKVVVFPPAGNRNNSTGNYDNISLNANYWSVTAGVNRKLNYNNTSFDQNSNDSRNGFSVRCLRNLNEFYKKSHKQLFVG